MSAPTKNLIVVPFAVEDSVTSTDDAAATGGGLGSAMAHGDGNVNSLFTNNGGKRLYFFRVMGVNNEVSSTEPYAFRVKTAIVEG